MVRVDEPYVIIVDKADGLICGDTSWWLWEIGLKVDKNPCLVGGGVTNPTDLQAAGDDVDYPFWNELNNLVCLAVVSNG